MRKPQECQLRSRLQACRKTIGILARTSRIRIWLAPSDASAQLITQVIANDGDAMVSLLHFDQSTLANMTAALEYVCRKLLTDRDNPAIRKYIAEEILAVANKWQTSLADLTAAGLKINSYLFPPGRPG